MKPKVSHRGKRRGKHTEPPAEYVDQIKAMAALVPQWIALQDEPPVLQWHAPGDTAFIGALQGAAIDYLAASPDARRLLVWLDDKTGGKCTIMQATVALQMAREIPDGVNDHAIPPSPCGHCGKMNDAATVTDGAKRRPEPGDVALCAACLNVNRYGPGMLLEAVTDAELEPWVGADNAANIRRMQAQARGVVMRKPGAERGRT